jgi:hypothetical protein
LSILITSFLWYLPIKFEHGNKIKDTCRYRFVNAPLPGGGYWEAY